MARFAALRRLTLSAAAAALLARGAAGLTAAQVSTMSAAIVADFGMQAQYGVVRARALRRRRRRMCAPAAARRPPPPPPPRPPRPAAAIPTRQACNPCTLGDTYGALVRLPFHDTFGQGTSPNGCIDFREPANNGLQAIVAQLAASWAPFSASISKADYWVLAATLAIQFSSTPAAGGTGRLPPSPGVLTLPFVTGRVDAATCNDVGLLPGAGFSWAQSAAFFGSVGLSVADIVALFGAHALGRAEFQNSGFDGGWTTTQSSFSNAYYAQMLGIPWANLNASDVWLNGGSRPNTIRLRSDAEVAIAPASGCPRFGGGGGGGAPTPTCPFNTLTQASLASFAGSTAAWYAAFAPAWAKMVGAGYSALAAPAAVTPSASASLGSSHSPSPSRAAPVSPAPSRGAAPPPPANSAVTSSGIAGLGDHSVAIIAGVAGGCVALIALVAAVVVASRRRSSAAVAAPSAAAAAHAPTIMRASSSDPSDDHATIAVPVAMPAPSNGVVLDGIPVPMPSTQPIVVRDIGLYPSM